MNLAVVQFDRVESFTFGTKHLLHQAHYRQTCLTLSLEGGHVRWAVQELLAQKGEGCIKTVLDRSRDLCMNTFEKELLSPTSYLEFYKCVADLDAPKQFEFPPAPSGCVAMALCSPVLRVSQWSGCSWRLCNAFFLDS